MKSPSGSRRAWELDYWQSLPNKVPALSPYAVDTYGVFHFVSFRYTLKTLPKHTVKKDYFSIAFYIPALYLSPVQQQGE
jgi:hypothetical protein